MSKNVGSAVKKSGVDAVSATDCCVTLGRLLCLSGPHSPYP